MNQWNGIGRLTKDPDVRYSSDSQLCIARFTLAIDRPSSGGEKKTDFPMITVFGKQAENVEKYCYKGMRVAVSGSVQTGSYEKDGRTISVTGITASRVEFLESKKEREEKPEQESYIGEQFEMLDEDLPF